MQSKLRYLVIGNCRDCIFAKKLDTGYICDALEKPVEPGGVGIPEWCWLEIKAGSEMSNWQDQHAALLELSDCQNELDRLSFWQVLKIFRATKRQDCAIKNLLSTYVFDLQAARVDRALKSWRADRVKDFLCHDAKVE